MGLYYGAARQNVVGRVPSRRPQPLCCAARHAHYTYDLGNLLADFVDEDKVFNFREFFRTDERGTFVHDDYVGDFLDLLCRNDEDSLYPYANAEFRHIFRHTLWVLPGVKAAKSLSQKLQAHPVFGAFTVVNVAGEGDADEKAAMRSKGEQSHRQRPRCHANHHPFVRSPHPPV